MDTTWNKEKRMYEVQAFGSTHEFTSEADAANYCKEVNDWWMQEYDYLDSL